MRYIGSKTKLLNLLKEEITTFTALKNDATFCDIFSGTCGVGDFFQDIYKIIAYLKENNKCDYLVTKEELEQSSTSRQLGQNTGRSDGMEDEKFEEVAYYIVRNQNSSANAIAQEFNMGYNRTNNIILALERLGVVSSVVRGKQREVLVNEVELEMILNEL